MTKNPRFSRFDLDWEFAHFFVDPCLISSPKIENEFVQSQVYSLNSQQVDVVDDCFEFRAIDLLPIILDPFSLFSCLEEFFSPKTNAILTLE